MTFSRPELLQLLWLIPLMGLFRWRRMDSLRGKYLKVFNARILEYLAQSFSRRKAAWKFRLELVVVAFLIAALARPQSGGRVVDTKSEGLEIVLVMDVSPSMSAEDAKPNRLEAAKILAKKFLETLGGDRAGLVAFSGSAMMVSPLTPDRSALAMYIDSLDFSSVSTRGTDFGKAFQEVVRTFKGPDGESKEKTSGATRVAVLFSDGENHEEGLDEGVNLLKDENVRLYTVTLGTEQGGPLPERDGMGYLRGYKKDRSGQTVNSTARYELMSDLARRDGGASFAGDFSGAAVRDLAAHLEKLQRGEFESRRQRIHDERFQIPLFAAVLFALIEICISARRAPIITRVRWRTTTRSSTTTS